MLLKKLFTPVKSLEPDEVKAYFAEHPTGAYTLLDVRQAGEYEESHLPGAKLIPLPQLNDSLKELDPEKPTLVYCAIGGRSRVAAQLLSGYGFKEVYNLAGGIKAFQGLKAAGPRELNLDLVRGDESPSDIIRLACGMEKALENFYDILKAQTQDPELGALFSKLAAIEVQHQQKLFDRYAALNPSGPGRDGFEASVVTHILEGGYNFEEFLAKNEPLLKSAPEVLELALMLETQALDLYLRLADKCADRQTQEVLHALATEEKGHLAALGRLLDQQR
ncbi:MAG: rhodanese-like domain-containing protein [Thermodesulfobacteriota bacterium]